MNILEVIVIGITLLYILNDFLLLIALKFINTPAQTANYSGISVIIAARNEIENLKNNLPSVCQQEHKNFEVILVDDQSVDKTSEFINNLKLRYSNFKYIKVSPAIKSSKKNALTLGIEKAEHEHLIFTDADCKPLSKHWLSAMGSYFDGSEAVVLGYSPYKSIKGNLNKIIRYETYQTALNYFGYAKLGYAYMGVGRNLGYTKSLFNKAQGFKSHLHLLSGDDDLLVNQVADQVPVKCSLEPDSFVESMPKTSLKSWIKQKRRHYTTAPSYNLKHKLLLTYQYFIKFLLWFVVLPLSVLWLLNGAYEPFFVLVVGLTFKLFVSRSIHQQLRVKDLWLASALLEFQLICLQLYIFSLNLYSSKQQW